MPVFPIEFTAQSTIHQRQIIQVEADSIEDAIEAVQSYDIDNSQATDLGKPIFTEWLVDDVKAYDPNNSPLALPSTCIDHQAQLAAQKPLLYLATDIVYATDGAEAVLPSEMSVEVEATIPADQHAEIVTNTISERTGWLVESLKIEQSGASLP